MASYINTDSNSVSDNEKGIINYNARVDSGDGLSPAIVNEAFAFDENLHRGLKQRHIQMIALAGAIGTGLFLSTGGALNKAGPLGILLAYSIVGAVVCCTQLAICEVSTLMPVTGGYMRHAHHFVDPALGFAVGWNNVYSDLVGGGGEIVAAAVLFQYWTDLNPAVWITIGIVLIFVSNMGPVKYYGEVEFIFSTLKILLILGLILLGLVIDLGGTSSPRLGFHYWKHPGPFAPYIKEGSLGNFIGFWAVLSSAVYAYGGVNGVSVAAGETQSPRTNIPRACRRIFVRVFLFYIVLILIVGMIVASDDDKIANGTGDANSSPFVIAAKNANIKVLPHIINAVVISSAWSAANSGMLSGSRNLYALAALGYAPKFLVRTNRWKVPYIAISIKVLFMTLGYMSVSSTAAVVFGWFQSLTSSSLLIGWIITSINHIGMDKALKAQGYSRDDLPWKVKVTPFLARFALGANILLILTGGFTVFIKGYWDTSRFFSAYFNIPLIFALYGIGKLVTKQPPRSPKTVDLENLFADIRNNPENVPPAKGIQRLNFLWG